MAGKRKQTNAIIHLSSIYEWEEQNCPRRAPRISRIDALACQVRQAVYLDGAQCVKRIQSHRTKNEYELRPLANDTMSANRDRPFREIPKFAIEAFGDITDKTLGISDIESLGDYQSVNMHVFGPGRKKEICSDMTLGYGVAI